jgi:serralysin
VVEAPNEGVDEIRTSLAVYSLGALADVEKLSFVGTGDARLTGNDGANVLTGGAGNDLLDGGAGADRLVGGTGDDVYIVDDAGDAVVEAPNEGVDEIRTSLAAYSLAALADVEKLSFAGAGDARLTGNDGANVLTGGAGNDLLDGGAGADRLVGGAGDDVYIVDDAGDAVVEAPNEGVDEIRTSLAVYSLAALADVEKLSFVGTGAARLTGNDGANVLTGGAGNDVLDGGAGADRLVGGAGDDVYIVDDAGDAVVEAPGEGVDEIRTSLAVYSLAALADVEKLSFVGTGAARLTGNAGANVLTGGAGNDLLDGGAGADRLVGGAGDDVYIVDDAGDAVVEAPNEGVDEIRTSLAVYSLAALADVEKLSFAGTGAARLTGNDGANVLTGGAGNDLLDGGAGADRLVGGAGDDVYIVDDAGDAVVEAPNEGVDEIRTSLAVYSLTALADVEKLSFAGAGDARLTGNAGANVLTGGAGNDVLDGGAGADRLAGGIGDDWYYIDNVNDVIVEAVGEGTGDRVFSSVSYALGAGANVEILSTSWHAGTAAIDLSGNEFSQAVYGNEGANVLRGGGGADTLTGNGDGDHLFGDDGNDWLDGGAGNDLLDGGAGADRLVGGAGDDVYIVDDVGDAVVEAPNEGVDEIRTSLAVYSLAALADVEKLSFVGTGAARLTGNAGANVLTGGAGGDLLDGGAGADRLVGGAGDDVYIVDDAGDAVVEAPNEGVDEIRTSLAVYSLAALADVEKLSFAGTGDARLTGNDGANVLTGGAGNDLLDGGAGADRLVGGAGDDWYYIDNVNDVIVEAAGEGTGDRMFSSVSYALGAGANVEILSTSWHAGTAAIDLSGNEFSQAIYGNEGANTLRGGGGADTLTGNGGDDHLFGEDGNDWLDGGAGNDLLDGGAGADRLAGGIGDDWYYIDNVNDVIVEAAGEGTGDRVFSSVSYALGAGANVEILSTSWHAGTDAIDLSGNEFSQAVYGNEGANVLRGGGGADTLTGNGGDDHLFGDDGNDWLDGGAGNDVLDGGEGTNTLVGGSGNDLFDISTLGDNSTAVTILDFASGTDRIGLGHSAFSGLSLGTIQPSQFHQGASAAAAGDRIIFDSSTGNLYFDADGSGSGQAVLIAHLQAGISLQAADLFVF